MRIKELTIKSDVFPNKFKINFNLPSNGPSIHYLVGNNGSGKTWILDLIYYSFGAIQGTGEQINQTVIEHLEIKCCDGKNYSFMSQNHGHSTHLHKIDDPYRQNINIGIIQYLTPDLSLHNYNVTRSSTRNIDQVQLVEKANNLNEAIPQMFVDLQYQDGIKNTKFLEDNAGRKINIPQDTTSRLSRFISAYNKLIAPKKFDDVGLIDNSYQVTFTDNKNLKINLNQLSTGEKQIIYNIGFLLKNLQGIKSGIILIDEPELSLHPKLQLKLKDFILEVFKGIDIQFIIATHSPYIFGDVKDVEECLLINREKSKQKKLI